MEREPQHLQKDDFISYRHFSYKCYQTFFASHFRFHSNDVMYLHVVIDSYLNLRQNSHVYQWHRNHGGSGPVAYNPPCPDTQQDGLLHNQTMPTCPVHCKEDASESFER